MNYPLKAIPTDNLYKFAALFGLVWMLVPPAYYTFIEVKIHEEHREFRERVISDFALLDSSEEIIGRQQKLLTIAEGIHLPNSTEAQSEKASSRLAEIVSESRKLDQQSKPLHAELNRRQKTAEAWSDLIDFKVERLKEWRIAVQFSFCCGMLLSLGGFIMWYFRTQRYMDAILKKRAEQVEEENVG